MGTTASRPSLKSATITLRDVEQRVLRLLCFLTRSLEREDWRLHIAVCGDATALACQQFMDQELDPTVAVRDDLALAHDLSTPLRIVATRLMQDEHTFEFDAS